MTDKSLPGLKGKEPVVYPWMKKIHVSTGKLTASPPPKGAGMGEVEVAGLSWVLDGGALLCLIMITILLNSENPLVGGSLYQEIYETPNCEGSNYGPHKFPWPARGSGPGVFEAFLEPKCPSPFFMAPPTPVS